MKVYAFAALMVGAVFTSARAQHVELRIAGKLAPQSVSVFQYDTLYQLEAVAIDTRGRKAASAKPTLDFHMWEVAKPVYSGKAKANVVALARGQAMAVAQWARADGHVFLDTLLIQVPRPRAITVQSCWFFTDVVTDGGTQKHCVPSTTIPVGSSRCLYVTAQDRTGAFITGLDPGLRSSNPAVASLSSSPECPDTTISPYKLR